MNYHSNNKNCVIMKVALLPLIILLASSTINAQIENMPEDSVAAYLNKKWQVKAMFMAGQPINSSGETVTYEFDKNYSFVRITDKKTEKGTWKYEPEKKVVHLQIKKKTNLYILALTPKEFTLST